MSKKILDAAVSAAFCVCLIVSSNIPEKSSQTPQPDTTVTTMEYHPRRMGALTAGASFDLLEHSFTTESDEETDVESKHVILVASSEELSPEEEKNVKQSETGEPVTETVADAADDADSEIKEVSVSSITNNRWDITLTEEEIELLARIVWLEANGEPVEGQEAVVEVVFNRMASDLYPDTLYDVLSQKNPVQFCSWKNRNIAEPTEKEYESIRRVLNGNTNILRNDTLYFSTQPLTSHTDVRIGGHSFCY